MEKKNLIEQYNLDNVKKRLDEINGYIARMDEEGEQNPNPEQGGEMDDMPQQQGAEQQMRQPMGQDNMQNGDVPPAEATADNTADMTMPETGGEEEDYMEVDDIEPEDEDAVETDIETEDDEVIDVDDLTTSQENTEIKIGELNQNLSTLLSVVNDLKDAIDNNDKKVDELRKEYERRNPTAAEKTDIRRRMGAPYDTTASGYWEVKADQMNNDNMVDPRQDTDETVYEITLDDINNINDKSVSDSMKYPKKLSDYINI